MTHRMTHDGDPFNDRKEFEARLNIWITRKAKQYGADLTMATAIGDVANAKKISDKLKAWNAWKEDCLKKWDSAPDEEGRQKVVGNLTIHAETIEEQFKPKQ